MYQARYRFGMRNDGSHNPAMIQRLEQGAAETGIPGLVSRCPAHQDKADSPIR